MSIYDYQAAIKITFDKEIVTDPEIITGTEYYENRIPEATARTPISSGDNATYPKANAFDKDITTFWRSSTTTAPQWLGTNLGAPVTLTKVGVQMDYSSGRINAYKIQGSANGVDWVDVASGNFLNTSGEQAVTFAATTYQYWRVYATSKFSSYYTITEFVLYSTRNTYSTAGWTVTGAEYDMQPEGSAIAGAYTVRKVTKTPDNLSVILWLDMFDRMRDPALAVTVAYNKLFGNLQGALSAVVESFELVFVPTNIVPISNPHDKENLSVAALMAVNVVDIGYKYIPAESNTFLILDLDNPYMDENISILTSVIVTVTKVGSLPL